MERNDFFSLNQIYIRLKCGVNWVNLHGETGLEVPQDANQDENYAAAVDRLVMDDNLRKQYAQAAHERVANNFLLKNMLDAMEEVYGEM